MKEVEKMKKNYYCKKCGRHMNGKGFVSCPYCGTPLELTSVKNAREREESAKKHFSELREMKEKYSIVACEVVRLKEQLEAKQKELEQTGKKMLEMNDRLSVEKRSIYSYRTRGFNVELPNK